MGDDEKWFQVHGFSFANGYWCMTKNGFNIMANRNREEDCWNLLLHDDSRDMGVSAQSGTVADAVRVVMNMLMQRYREKSRMLEKMREGLEELKKEMEADK